MTQNESRIINHWSFIGFAKEFGAEVHVGTCKSKTGEEFPAVSFDNGEKRTFAHFGESLEGGLTFAELVTQAEKLQVVQLKVDPEVLERRQKEGAQLESYSICVKGESAWEGGNILAMLGKS